MSHCDYAAAVLKGEIEHHDKGAYLNTSLDITVHTAEARRRGWLLPNGLASEAGYAHYNESGLSDFPSIPNRRAYFWDWSKYKP